MKPIVPDQKQHHRVMTAQTSPAKSHTGIFKHPRLNNMSMDFGNRSMTKGGL